MPSTLGGLSERDRAAVVLMYLQDHPELMNDKRGRNIFRHCNELISGTDLEVIVFAKKKSRKKMGGHLHLPTVGTRK
jgi:hypothetical protein